MYFIVSKIFLIAIPKELVKGLKFQLSFMLLSLLWEEMYSRSAMCRDQRVTQANG
jgi:hypothetical protein